MDAPEGPRTHQLPTFSAEGPHSINQVRYWQLKAVLLELQLS